MAHPLRLRDPDAVARNIEMFIFAQLSRAQGAVVALSGGIDSALVLALAVRALGPERIVGLLMPDGSGTPDEDMDDARSLARGFGVNTHTLSLKTLLREFQRLEISDFSSDLPTWGNVKARLRMTVNYAVANHQNRVVLGTGNRTEVLLGYYTKYGDGGVDLLPLAGLYKTQVKQLAQHLKLPLAFINKPPSAGLWPGQTDEKDLGAPYELIDRILRETIDLQHRPQEVAQSLQIDEQLVHDFIRRVKTNDHKRKLPPIAEIEL